MAPVLLSVLSVLGIGCAVTASAGPWPRPVGEAFLAAGHELRADGGWDGIYAEYGWGPRLTLVLDLGRSASDASWTAMAALRVPVWSSGESRVAVSLGSGLSHPKRASEPSPEEAALLPRWLISARAADQVAQVGLHWGMGFTSDLGAGWASVDAVWRIAPGGSTGERKLDATLGLNLTPSRAILSQIQYSAPQEGDPQIRLGLGWLETFGRVTVEIGLGQRFLGEGGRDLKLGLWTRF